VKPDTLEKVRQTASVNAHVGRKANYVDIAVGQVEPKWRCTGDAGIKGGEILHHIRFGDRLLVRPTFMADTHRFLPIQGNANGPSKQGSVLGQRKVRQLARARRSEPPQFGVLVSDE